MKGFTTLDRVLAKLTRELPSEHFVEEDVVEWIGEALDFLQVRAMLEERVEFLEVKNYHAVIPKRLQFIIQIARMQDGFQACCNKKPETQSVYENWITSNTYKHFTPVRLSNHSFFNSVVCQDNDKSAYTACKDEYTIVGTVNRELRFSFKDGIVAIAYLRTTADENGFPYIIDDATVMTALSYYVKWKVAELRFWKDGDRTSQYLSVEMKNKWDEYIGKAKNKLKMPQSVDEYQNLKEGSLYILPRDKYYGFFGNLNTKPRRLF